MEKNPLYISIDPDEKENKAVKITLQKGTPELVSFVIENRSNDFVLLRRLELEGQLPDINRWFGPLYGSVGYSEEQDVFFYNVVEQCLSEPVFVMGLIRPQGKIKLDRMIAQKDSPVKFEIYYQRITVEDAKKNLYFNFPDEPGMGPKRIFRNIENFDDFLNSSKTDTVDWSTVILKGENKLPFQRQEITCEIFLKEPAFSLEKALAKFGFLVSDYIFWKSENCWVFKREKAVFVVGENKITKLGEMDLTIFTLIELSPDKVEFILPMEGYDDFSPQMPKIEGPGYFNPGITHLPKNKAFSLFQHAAHRGEGIKTMAYDAHGLGKRFYILVGDFNEKKRRTFANSKVN